MTPVVHRFLEESLPTLARLILSILGLYVSVAALAILDRMGVL
jgi:hypothetical protein